MTKAEAETEEVEGVSRRWCRDAHLTYELRRRRVSLHGDVRLHVGARARLTVGGPVGSREAPLSDSSCSDVRTMRDDDASERAWTLGKPG